MRRPNRPGWLATSLLLPAATILIGVLLFFLFIDDGGVDVIDAIALTLFFGVVISVPAREGFSTSRERLGERRPSVSGQLRAKLEGSRTLGSSSVGRRLRQKIHNPFNWTCNCDPTCWCNTTRWGRVLMWYIPPRFHRFPPKG
jgi:hypothetical protein